MDGRDGGYDDRGHLDLRDAGSSDVEGATRLEVLDGPQGETWAERLDRAGVTPFLRRHPTAVRRFVAAAVVVALVSGGATAYALTRPPEEDGVVAVDVWQSGPVVTTDDLPGASGTVALSYGMLPRRSGDVVRLVGLQGPGVRASAGSETGPMDPGRATDHWLVVVPACDDPALLPAQDSQYGLVVERTDAWGRSATGLVPIPPAETDLRWPHALGAACLGQWFAESVALQFVDVVRAGVTAGQPGLRLVLRMSSSFDADLRVTYTSDPYGYWSAWRVNEESSGTIPSHGAGTIAVSVPLPDCTSAPFTAARLSGGLAMQAEVRPIQASGHWSEPVAGPVTVSWPPGVSHRIEALLSAMCVDAPSATVTVVEGRAGSNAALTAPLADTGTPVRVVRARLRVASTATQVTVGDTTTPAAAAAGRPLRVSTASARLVDGSALLTVDWATDCDPSAGPPTVQLVLTEHGNRYPRQGQLIGPAMTRGFLQACGLLYDSIRSLSWPSPT